jgi:hypothetical protein
MTVYYRGPEAMITHEVFRVYVPQRRTFRIEELSDVHVLRGDLHPVRVVAAHTAGGALVVVAASWPFVHTPTAFLLMLMLVAAPSAVSGACSRLTPRPYELRATYRSLEVRLYRSTDERMFGQVKRGLIRSLEGMEAFRQ